MNIYDGNKACTSRNRYPECLPECQRSFFCSCRRDVYKRQIKPRRAGDIATCYSDATKAKNELGWEAQYGIEEMCADSWKWQSMNPNGYRDSED